MSLITGEPVILTLLPILKSGLINTFKVGGVRPKLLLIATLGKINNAEIYVIIVRPMRHFLLKSLNPRH